MKESFKTLRGGYQTPECEAVNLACGSSVIMQSPGTTIQSWNDEGEDDDLTI